MAGEKVLLCYNKGKKKEEEIWLWMNADKKVVETSQFNG